MFRCILQQTTVASLAFSDFPDTQKTKFSRSVVFSVRAADIISPRMNMRRLLVYYCVLSLCFLDFSTVEGRKKKVVIHVPYKVKKIKHTHTVYKTIHHHHTHHDQLHGPAPSEEHEHFHHLHVHDESPSGQHSQPVPGLGIPEFLPDVPMEVPMDIPDVPREMGVVPNRHFPIPVYRRV